jgi:hypothetical protein
METSWIKRHETASQAVPVTRCIACRSGYVLLERSALMPEPTLCRPGPLSVVRSAGLPRAGVLAQDGKIRGPLVWSPDEHEPPLVRSGHHN